ncbi:MAG: S-ribosylhomocysteine lyase [Muribaculaceae bacterium]|nr:S-ribosylhomocysteine lyase [Muribaculaceae bacterium]
MEKIPSFTINHLILKRGIYVSRKDVTDSGDIITTFDIRMKEPNREPALDIEVLHTIEHLAATFLRNNNDWKNKVIYWGPMGCCTGNYFVVKGNLESKDVIDIMIDTFAYIAKFDGEVPGATPRDCGNYTLMNLPLARKEASDYLEQVLLNLTPYNLTYPD